MNNIDNFFSRNPSEFADKYLAYLSKVIEKINPSEISNFIDLLIKIKKKNAQVFFIGNGGSAATCSHFANDLAIGINDYSNPLRVTSLTDNVPVITAIANDFNYKEIFSRQLMVLANEGDMLVAISASGNSENLIEAVEYANTNKIETLTITSFDGGKLKSLSNHSIHIPTDYGEYGPAEDAHMIIDHLVGSFLMRLFKSELNN